MRAFAARVCSRSPTGESRQELAVPAKLPRRFDIAEHEGGRSLSLESLSSRRLLGNQAHSGAAPVIGRMDRRRLETRLISTRQ